MSLMTLISDHLWGLVVVGGFIVLGAAIAFAMLRNKTTRRQHQHSEDATRRLYDAQPREDQTLR